MKPIFVGNPVLEWLTGRHQYRLIQTPLKFFAYRDGFGRWIVPTDGQYTDQGSVPSIFTPWLPRDAYWSFLIHDYTIRNHGYMAMDVGEDGMPRYGWTLGFVHMTRKECDDMLREGCRSEGASWVMAALVWAGVRLGSWVAWNNQKK